MNEKLTPVIVYGETADRDRQDKFLEWITDGKSVILYLAAGLLPFQNRDPLKKRMFDYIRANLVSKGFHSTKETDAEDSFHFQRGGQVIRIVLLQGNAWGTIEETLRLLQEAQGNEAKEITVISSESHIPRIEHIWKRLAPEYRVTAVSADQEMADGLVKAETKKDKMAEVFFRAYETFGCRGLFAASWIKNLVINVPAAKKEGHYYCS